MVIFLVVESTGAEILRLSEARIHEHDSTAIKRRLLPNMHHGFEPYVMVVRVRVFCSSGAKQIAEHSKESVTPDTSSIKTACLHVSARSTLHDLKSIASSEGMPMKMRVDEV